MFYVVHQLKVPVSGVRVLSATAVLGFWNPVPLPLEELTGYRVDYREVVQTRKRLVNGNGTDEGSRNFSSEATSGVVENGSELPVSGDCSGSDVGWNISGGSCIGGE